jgi:WD40 repeat protein
MTDLKQAPLDTATRSQVRAANRLTRDDRPFNGFISYHRASQGRLAEALHRALAPFASGWLSRRTLRIFRDKANISVNPALRSTIYHALERSEFLILLASPKAAASRWVDDEVRYWRDHKPIENLLLVVTDGDFKWDAELADFARSTPLPPSLFGAFPEEPGWLDLRWAKDSKRLRMADPEFRQAIAEIAAPLRHVSKDEIIGEDRRRHRRRVGTVAVTLVLLSLLTVIAILAALSARRQRDEALRAERVAVTRGVVAQAGLQHRFDRDELGVLLARAGYVLNLQTSGAAREEIDLALRSSMSARPFTRVLESPLPLLQRVSVDPSGRFIAAAGTEPGRQLALWDLRHPTTAPRLLQGSRTVAFSTDGRTLVTGSGGDVLLWNPYRGQAPKAILHASGDLFSVAISPDGRMVAAGNDRGTVYVWGLDDGHSPTVVQGPRRIVRSMAFHPTGRMLAWGSDSGSVHLWHVGERSTAATLVGRHAGIASSVAFSADGTRLASGGYDGLVKVWRLDNLRAAPLVQQGNSREVTSVAFTPDGRTLTSGLYDGTIRLWSLRKPKQAPRIIRGHGTAVSPVSIAYSKEGRLLVSANQTEVVVRDLAFGADGVTRRLVFTGDDAQIHAVAFDRSGSRIADGTSGGSVWVRSLRDGSTRKLRPPGANFILSVAFAPGRNQVVAAGGGTAAVPIWVGDLSTRRWSSFGGSRVDTVNSIAVTGDGRTLAAATRDGRVRLYSLDEPNRPTDRIAGGIVWSVAFDPTGRRVVAGIGVGQGAASIWDVGDPSARPVILEQEDGVSAVAFSPDGRLVALGRTDGTVALWDPAAGTTRVVERIPEPPGGEATVDSVAFSVDGRTLFAGSHDQTVRLWHLDPSPQARS